MWAQWSLLLLRDPSSKGGVAPGAARGAPSHCCVRALARLQLQGANLPCPGMLTSVSALQVSAALANSCCENVGGIFFPLRLTSSPAVKILQLHLE